MDLPDTKPGISIDGLGRVIAGWSDNPAGATMKLSNPV